jgi:hypothetical protein
LVAFDDFVVHIVVELRDPSNGRASQGRGIQSQTGRRTAAKADV